MDQHFWVREDFVFPDVFRISNFPRIKPVSFLLKSRSSSLRNTWNMKAVQQTAVQTPRSWALRSFSMKAFISLPIHALLKVKISANWQFLLKFKKRKQTKTGKAGSLLVLILVYFLCFWCMQMSVSGSLSFSCWRTWKAMKLLDLIRFPNFPLICRTLDRSVSMKRVTVPAHGLVQGSSLWEQSCVSWQGALMCSTNCTGRFLRAGAGCSDWSAADPAQNQFCSGGTIVQACGWW